MRGGPNLAKRIQSATLHKNFLFRDFPQSTFLNLATQEEIVDIACTFPAGTLAGYDNIPMSIIKRSIGSISSPLTHIINLSIIHGIVPGEFVARVVPIFKSGDKTLFGNLQTYFSYTLLFKVFGANNLQPYHKLSQ